MSEYDQNMTLQDQSPDDPPDGLQMTSDIHSQNVNRNLMKH